jgi:tetratricopeptide (TPR) repeat protein
LEILDVKGNTLWQYRFTSVGNNDVFMDMAIPDLNFDGWPDILLSHTVINLSGALDSYLYFLENQIRIAPSAKTFDNYNRGVEFFNNGDYSQALDYFTQALTAFQNAENQEMVENCQTYIDRCTDLIAQQEEADTLFSDAEIAYEEGNYQEAQSLYERAQSLYESLGNDQQVQACADRLTEIQQREPPEKQPVEEQPEKKRSFLPFLIVLLVVLAGGGFFALKYLRKPHIEEVTELPEKIQEGAEPAEKGKGELEELEELEEPAEPAEKIPQSARIRKRERELKAQFVYGEINRKQYQEELRKLYEEESGD